MSRILTGAPVARALREESAARIEALRRRGVAPCLALVRVGENGGSLSYERSAMRECGRLGVEARSVVLPADCDTAALAAALRALSADAAVHGILLLHPLPAGIDEAAACAALAPRKDVDGVTDASLRRVFTGRGEGFCPCTPEAVLALLDYYGVMLDGTRTALIGRSLIVGKPLSLLLTGRGATVTLCHRRTRALAALCRESELLIAAAGSPGLVGADFTRPGQVVIDVGTTPDASGQLRGDVEFDAVSGTAEALSPVPGGVGAITTAVLLRHVVEAAENAAEDHD